jgi:DDE superfamily endonuclease
LSSGLDWSERVFRPNVERHERNRKWLWREIDRAIAAGVRFGCALADAGYGLSAPFRRGLRARKLTWAVGIPRHLKVLPCRCVDDLASCQVAQLLPPTHQDWENLNRTALAFLSLNPTHAPKTL